MATAPSFFSRLFRPFTTGTARFNGEGAGGAALKSTLPDGSEAAKCTIAAGCFWGVEHMYRHTFAGKGLLDARVGYIGGDSSNPSYRAVCSGRTGRKFLFLHINGLPTFRI